jgi:hypothetical protein
VAFARRTFGKRRLSRAMQCWGTFTVSSKIKRVAFRRGMVGLCKR